MTIGTGPGAVVLPSVVGMTTDTEPAVLVEHLAKRYKRGRNAVHAVRDVSLRVEPGACLGVLGANGAGKTTTMEMIAGLRRPTGGRVRVLGLDPRADRARLRQVLGVQLQEPQLHSSLQVRELLDLYRTFYPDPRPASELLDLVDLSEERRTRFDNLSGGQQQRLSIALALVGRPRVVILDELTTGLDPRARRHIWAMVEGLSAQGTTVLLVSHAMEEIERLCDHVVLLDAGRVLTAGTPADLVAEAGAQTLDEAFVRLTGQDPRDIEEKEKAA